MLFANEQAMQDALVAGVHAAPDGAALIRAGLDAVAAELEPRRDDLRRRAALIASHPALRERELGKQAATAETLREALVERGTEPSAAQVAAEVAVVLLRVAFDRWLEQPGSLSGHVAAALAQAETLA